MFGAPGARLGCAGHNTPLCGSHPLELHKATHVVDQVHEPDLGASARHADGAHELAAHGVLLIPKHVLDAGAHA